jgi:hypothetical protein
VQECNHLSRSDSRQSLFVYSPIPLFIYPVIVPDQHKFEPLHLSFLSLPQRRPLLPSFYSFPFLAAATVVPKAIGQLSASLGGLTLLQSEVLSILSSPLTPATLRAKGLHTLSNLRKAHAEDKKRSAEDRERQLAEAADLEAQAVAVERGMKEREEKGELPEGKKDEKTGEVRSSGPGVEEKGVRGKTVVRKHGVYIDARKHYEVSDRPCPSVSVLGLSAHLRLNSYVSPL